MRPVITIVPLASIISANCAATGGGRENNLGKAVFWGDGPGCPPNDIYKKGQIR